MKRATWKLVRRMNSHRLASAAKAISKVTIRAARRSGVCNASASRAMAAIRTAVRQASPNSKRRRNPSCCLKAMLFHAPVERAAAETELACRQRDIEMVHPERPLDHLLFELVEVERPAERRQRGGFGPTGEREILEPVGVAVGEDDGALGGVAQRPDV